MINYFPISRATFVNSQRPSLPPPVPPAENITIERLRLENESLKKQLSDLLKTQPRESNTAEECPKAKLAFVNNNQQDFQASFQKKMSKLKARRSNRKSVDEQNFTSPNSPQKAADKQQMQMKNITNLPFRESPYKMMIIELDQNGKYFRNKEKEENVVTTRNTSSQPALHQRNSVQVNRAATNNFSQIGKVKKEPPKPKMHQRAESSFERQAVKMGDTTQRIFPRKTETLFQPTFSSNSRQKIMAINNDAGPSQLNKIPKFSYPIKKDVTLQVKRSQNIDRKQQARCNISSPRGNAYIEKIEALQNIQNYVEGKSEQSIPDDSFVSIEKGLKQKKTVRKLRYDIYLAEQIGEQ